MGIIGIVVSILFFFIALIFFDAIKVNVADCTQFNHTLDTPAGDDDLVVACESGKTYAGIAFTIAPIGILLDVFGILPIFRGAFSYR